MSKQTRSLEKGYQMMGMAAITYESEKAHLETVANVIHQTERTFQAIYTLLENDIPNFLSLTKEEVTEKIEDVKFYLENQKSGVTALHQRWINKMIQQGWNYGEIYDELNLTSPLLCPYSQLPVLFRKKYELFVAIIKVLTSK